MLGDKMRIKGHGIMTVVVIGLIGFGIARIVSGEYNHALVNFIFAALISFTMDKEAQPNL